MNLTVEHITELCVMICRFHEELESLEHGQELGHGSNIILKCKTNFVRLRGLCSGL